ncbi:DUF397 domain-containing protein [Streptomyces kanamyceticus]|uniref:DUF397 domain-containing protein n=1 Tax=Streptomyces kanamyceticus TaxID=1967 RepID=A0A5J6GIL0_STRKN|nr:DUF397 domain-containing protein [Streptomyces kanamyceticus]QEU93765.1 DUF397 domain-containing protein [Streptomyces kanamyceticus]
MTPNWHKSTYSGNNDNCVEVATDPKTVMVRDTKDNETGPALAFGTAAWGAFIDATQR